MLNLVTRRKTSGTVAQAVAEDSVDALVAQVASESEDERLQALEEIARQISSDASFLRDEDPGLWKKRREFWEAGLARPLLQLIDTFEEFSDREIHLSLQCLRFLGRVEENDIVRALGQEMGAGEVVIRVIREKRQDAVVQKWACGALRNLALNTDNKVKLMDLGAADDIVEAMRTHRSDARVQEMACIALRNLAVNNDNKVKLMDLGAADDIVEAMRTHRSDARVQENACGALMNLAAEEANGNAIRKKKGLVELIRSAMTSHKYEPFVQQNAILFLCILIEDDKKFRDVKVALKGIPRLVENASVKFPNDADLQDAAKLFNELMK